jgi:RNA polymerase sigma factor (sigma-70 family)
VLPYLINNFEQLKGLSLRWIILKGFSLSEAEDLFQQSILKALGSKAELREHEKLQSWFMAILRNVVVDNIRSKNLHREKKAIYQREIDLFHENPEVEDSFCRCVNDFIEDLPAAERNLLKERFLHGKTFRDLSREYGISLGTLRVKSLRAKEKLRLMFKACCKVRKFKDFADCDCG